MMKMTDSRSFRRNVPRRLVLALAFSGLCGCSSITGEAEPTRRIEGKRSGAGATTSTAKAASERKKTESVRSPAADREETAAATADSSGSPRPASSADQLRKLEGGLRSLKSIPSLPVSSAPSELRTF